MICEASRSQCLKNEEGGKSTARVSLAKYFIPGCVGRGLVLDMRVRPAAPAPGNLRFSNTIVLLEFEN